MPKIAYCYIIYNESGKRLESLWKALAVTQTVTCDYYIIYDHATRKELLEEIKLRYPDKFRFVERAPIPEAYQHQASEYCLWEFYNNFDIGIEYQYYCFNHSDDIPFPTRVAQQYLSLVSHPECAVSLAGFHVVDIENCYEEPSYFQLTSKGFNVGYPSCWMLNKKVMSTIECNWDLVKEMRCHADIMLLYRILHRFPIVAIYQPLIEYTQHILYTPTSEYKQSQSLVEQFYFTTRINDQYYFPIKYYGRNPNEKVLFQQWYNTEFHKPNPLRFKEWRELQ